MRFIPRAVPVVAVIAIASLAIVGASAASPRATTTLRMWDVVPSQDWELRVRSIERRTAPRRWTAADGVPLATDQIALIAVDLLNRTDAPLRPQAPDFALRTASGQHFANRSAFTDARTLTERSGLVAFGALVAPGQQITTLLVFDLDPSTTHLTLSFRPAPRHPIRLDECHCSLPLPSARTLPPSTGR